MPDSVMPLGAKVGLGTGVAQVGGQGPSGSCFRAATLHSPYSSHPLPLPSIPFFSLSSHLRSSEQSVSARALGDQGRAGGGGAVGGRADVRKREGAGEGREGERERRGG